MANTRNKPPETAPQGEDGDGEGRGDAPRGLLGRALAFLRALVHAIGEISKQFPHFSY